jgi:hypothetical protein
VYEARAIINVNRGVFDERRMVGPQESYERAFGLFNSPALTRTNAKCGYERDALTA